MKFLKRNKWVSRRITSSGRDLPENSIETIIDFFVKMKAFSNENEVEFDSIINMDETCVYLDFSSNNMKKKYKLKEYHSKIVENIFTYKKGFKKG